MTTHTLEIVEHAALSIAAMLLALVLAMRWAA